jgi:ribonuclease HI
MTQSLFGSDTLSNGAGPQVDVYTDGGCDPNPGPGGWGAIIRWGDHEWVLNGKPVANRTEWEALIEAIRPHHVTWLLAQGDAIPGDMSVAGMLASQAADLLQKDGG